MNGMFIQKVWDEAWFLYSLRPYKCSPKFVESRVSFRENHLWVVNSRAVCKRERVVYVDQPEQAVPLSGIADY